MFLSLPLLLYLLAALYFSRRQISSFVFYRYLTPRFLKKSNPFRVAFQITHLTLVHSVRQLVLL
jgi:hypothetical protein